MRLSFTFTRCDHGFTESVQNGHSTCTSCTPRPTVRQVTRHYVILTDQSISGMVATPLRARIPLGLEEGSLLGA